MSDRNTTLHLANKKAWRTAKGAYSAKFRDARDTPAEAPARCTTGDDTLWNREPRTGQNTKAQHRKNDGVNA